MTKHSILKSLHWAVVLSVFYLVSIVFTYKTDRDVIRVTYLATSNLFAIPAIVSTLRKELWFETTYLSMMSTISVIYHIVYGMGFDLGLWFRHLDWIFAYTTGPIFINCFFMERHSYIKMVSNFWIFAIVSTFVNSFASSVITFAFPVILYTIYLFSVRNRHMKDISKKRGATTLLWLFSGVLLFFLADFLSCKDGIDYYWSLHSGWHVIIFMGIYYILSLGVLPDSLVSRVASSLRSDQDPHLTTTQVSWNI